MHNSKLLYHLQPFTKLYIKLLISQLVRAPITQLGAILRVMSSILSVFILVDLNFSTVIFHFQISSHEDLDKTSILGGKTTN